MDTKVKVAFGIGAAIGGSVLIYKAIKGSGTAPPPPPPGKANVYGLVLDNDSHQPVEGAMVSLGALQTVTGSDGAYQFIELNPGDYPISCERDDYEYFSDMVTLFEGNNSYNILFVPIPVVITYGTLGGVIYDAITCASLPGVSLTLHAPDGSSQQYTTGSDGTYQFASIPTGQAVLSLRKSGYRDLDMDLTIVEGLNGVSFSMTPISEPDYEAIFGAQAAELQTDKWKLFAATFKVVAMSRVEITTVYAHNLVVYPEDSISGFISGTIDNEWYDISPGYYNTGFPIDASKKKQVIVRKDLVNTYLASEDHTMQGLMFEIWYWWAGGYSDVIGSQSIVPVRI